ncbi:MAG: DUF4976 domain-containing protein [Draconibacterium sp.]|nr:DUF4976 domain-containing protein [Draconibacterium sp.]
MLYDLEKDPNEFNSLIDKPEYMDIIAELRQKLDSALIN